jgi:hypothetical protein
VRSRTSMRSGTISFYRIIQGSGHRIPALLIVVILSGLMSFTQTSANERSFPQAKATVDKALKAMQASLSGRLPSLEGFSNAADHPLEAYQRGYYQATAQVTPIAAGGALVLIQVKLTAWYADPVGARSGYQLLISNGRIEADLLDQLAEQLAKAPSESVTGERIKSAAQSSPPVPALARAPKQVQVAAEPAISAPAPKFPESGGTFSSTVSKGLAGAMTSPESTSEPKVGAANSALRAQADSLEEVLKNQAHPKNLVAVKASGTPVVGAASLTAKPLFMASLHDEFEMLDFNADWVHVRISGLSRGWIWRNSVEMPNGIPDTATKSTASLAPAADLFHVIREETASFPGDWEPLRGKNVKILSVQNVDEAATGLPKDRIEYAKYLFDKSYTDITSKPQDVAGVVVIFDSADGGMIAASLAKLQEWRAGKLSDSAFWHACFFDPPEALDSPATAASP